VWQPSSGAAPVGGSRTILVSRHRTVSLWMLARSARQCTETLTGPINDVLPRTVVALLAYKRGPAGSRGSRPPTRGRSGRTGSTWPSDRRQRCHGNVAAGTSHFSLSPSRTPPRPRRSRPAAPRRSLHAPRPTLPRHAPLPASRPGARAGPAGWARAHRQLPCRRWPGRPPRTSRK
jgi:hypothetical protein